MKVSKGNGYAWGMASVILSLYSIASPFLGVIVSFVRDDPELSGITFHTGLGYLLLPIGFAFAFIGKVRSEYGTKARKLCNIGAGISAAMAALRVWTAAFVFLKIYWSVAEQAAAITALIDTILLVGYFLVAYITGKLLWFI